MVLPKLKDEKAVLPFLLRIQSIAGLWGDRSQRYRFYLIFAYFIVMVVMPKVLFGYPDLEIAVRGTAELMFESNAFFGMLMFSFQRDNYEKLVHQLQNLATIGEYSEFNVQNAFQCEQGFSSTVANVCVQIILVTVETYGYCYFGTDLTTESFGVALAIYDSDWHKFPVSTRRKLQLLLQRSQKPVGVTAGKFRFVNVAQFGKMLKMSYSFYVVLKEQF
ncbi:odorant receptor 30a-like [Anopheles funestus]|uniref:odorant receptor 30a-like n=1 Tax=Anopheles funestus TaxID=62324 RepID=UPI0020C6166F|nr:odorant receptor 30a-like [Anopheles funestus]